LKQIIINHVIRLTADAVGEPGKRVFYLQVKAEGRLYSFAIEKFQIQQLGAGIARLTHEIQKKNPELEPAMSDYYSPNMLLEHPLESLFRVVEMGLGYDNETDQMLLLLQSWSGNDEEAPDDAIAVRIWASRSQMLALGAYGVHVAAQGRPICGNCLQPIDPDGHFCPQRNGHKH